MSLPDRQLLRLWLLLASSALSLAGCATLPSSGPTAHQIVRAERQLDRFEIVDLNPAAVARIATSPASGRGRIATLALPGEVDVLGPGDILQVSIYEVGAALFTGRTPTVDAFTPATGAAENLPPITVGRDGGVTLPWIGRIAAAGKTPAQLGEEITQHFRAKSENPQVLVAVRENIANTFIVQGDVRKPGRFPLTLARERLLDAIAIAGGSANPGIDSIVQLSRGDRLIDAPLSAIDPGAADDVVLLPQDRISIASRPRTFTVLGASGKVAEIPFQSVRVSLAEALGRAGGPSEQTADPSAVFVFRYEPAAFDGTPLDGAKPVAYRVDMRNPESYFLVQRFEMRPRDVIFVANARANLPTKAIQILNLFFSPFYTAKVLTQ